MTSSENEPDMPPNTRRRRILAGIGFAGLLGVGGVAGYRRITARDPPGDDLVSDIPEEELREIAHRYAPDLRFDRREKWFPTNALKYSTEENGETVVDGFHALKEYTRDYQESGDPPAPTVYWRAHDATEDVIAIQYWMYSVFDQFTVNFHWHDWELLQVFVDVETREPLLISASAHSRTSPNNEFLGPELSDGRRPIVLAELGSHSSAIDVNEKIPSFERLPDVSLISDITNDIVNVTERLDLPFAYGLPRDEGAHLPMVLPELDDVPLHEHPRLSNVIGRTDLLDEDVTVRGWQDLARPPSELPLREPGLVITHPNSSTIGEGTYELRPMQDVEVIEAFTGPQLSFEFPIPQFAEDAYAGHITSVGIPWDQPRYTDPLIDVSDFQHRLAVQGIEAVELLDRVVGRFTMLDRGADGEVDGMTEDELDEYGQLIAVSRQPLPVELAVRLASPEPAMVATNDGVFGFMHVEPGEHLFGAVGPGLAPVAVRFVHEGGTITLGAAGRLTVVANEDATWIRVAVAETTRIAHVRIIEDFAGPVYDGQPAREDRFAIAVHRDGRYVVDVIDQDGARGAYRVVPGERDEVILEDIEVGKRSLAHMLAPYLASTVELAYELCDGCELLTTYVGPRRAGFDDVNRILEATRGDVVALWDRVAVRLETATMPDLSAEETLESMMVEIHLIEGVGAPAIVDATDPGIAVLVGDTGVFVTIDTAESEVRFAPGQTWEVMITLPDAPPLEATTFEIVERRVELDGDGPPYRVTPTEEAIIAGESTMAPGTGLTVRVRLEGEMLRTQDVTIDDVGRFGARFDFSDRRVGETFELHILDGDRQVLIAESVITEEPSVPSFEPAERTPADGWAVVRSIARAAGMTHRLSSGADLDEGEINASLGDVRKLLEATLTRLESEEQEGFDQNGETVLARRLDTVIEWTEIAMETRV